MRPPSQYDKDSKSFGKVSNESYLNTGFKEVSKAASTRHTSDNSGVKAASIHHQRSYTNTLLDASYYTNHDWTLRFH